MEHRHTEKLLPEICKRKDTVLSYLTYAKLRFYLVSDAREFAKIVCQNVSNVQLVFKDVTNFE